MSRAIPLLICLVSLPAAAAPVPPLSFEIERKPRPDEPIRPAKHYADAKKRLARGQPGAALAVLKKSKSTLLDDRKALLRGDALLALRQKKAAKAAYLEAFESAQLKVIKERAARSLINVHRQLRERDEQLRYLELLLSQRRVSRRPALLLEKAVLLDRMKRRKASARLAWRIVFDFPASKSAEQAEALLERLEKKGVDLPEASTRLELARARNLYRSGKFDPALESLTELESKHPRLKHDIEMERAELYRRRGKKAQEQAILTRVYNAGLDAKNGPGILNRLGRLSMNRDDNTTATKYFDELAERFPKSREAPEAQYLAAWLPYNDGDYTTATAKFLDFARKFRGWERRPEALWFAGWSAYLSGRHALSRRAFDQLLEEHPTSDMIIWAHYWNGRIREQKKDLDHAKDAYRKVLRISPLSYFGQWSITRLNRLGETVVLKAPKDKRRSTVKRALELLGSNRPINVDRAISLHQAKLTKEALEELHGANRAFRRVRQTKGRVVVAELLERLGAHHQAFRLAMSITKDGADLVGGKPYAWRAWRLAYPKAFWDDVEAAAKTHDVDPFLVLSIMRTESHFRPWVRSRVGARGLMQLMPSTARRIGKKAEGGRYHAARYRRPTSNIWLGTWYLGQLLRRYDGQLALAIGAYNAGPRVMDRWMNQRHDVELDEFVEGLSYRETRRYIRRVLETYSIYRRLEGEEELDLAMIVRKVDPAEEAVRF